MKIAKLLLAGIAISTFAMHAAEQTTDESKQRRIKVWLNAVKSGNRGLIKNIGEDPKFSDIVGCADTSGKKALDYANEIPDLKKRSEIIVMVTVITAFKNFQSTLRNFKQSVELIDQKFNLQKPEEKKATLPNPVEERQQTKRNVVKKTGRKAALERLKRESGLDKDILDNICSEIDWDTEIPPLPKVLFKRNRKCDAKSEATPNAYKS